MKIWTGHGSEHSYSLVMIGTFKDARIAAEVEERFRRLREAAEEALPEEAWEPEESRFSTELRGVLEELGAYNLSRSDVSNFAYTHKLTRDGASVRIETDEGEVEGFLKTLIDAGAKIEVYSRHDWNADGSARSEEAAPE